MESTPAIGSDGTIYIGSGDRKVYALEGKTGAKKWEFETGSWTGRFNTYYGGVSSSPAIGADGTIYVGSNDKKVYALDGKTGAKKWEFKSGHAVQTSPAIGLDGTIYIGSDDYKLYALDGKTGAKRWEFTYKTGDDLHKSSPAIGSDGTVYFRRGGGFFALDGTTGNIKWEVRSAGKDSSPVIGPNGTLYIGLDRLSAIKTGSKGPAKSPWPMRGQNAQHTGRAPAK